jgi:hypothetical protein
MEQNHTASIAFQEFTKVARKLGGVGGQVIGLESYQLRYTGEAESEVANAILAIEAQNADLLEALENIENDDGSIPKAIWDMRNAVIAKAKGEDQ